MQEKYRINDEESKRISIIRFVSILFVLFTHSYSIGVQFGGNLGEVPISPWLAAYQGCVSQVITRCGVPLLFLLSAILFFSKERKYSQVLKSKCKTILVPYLFWNTFWIVVWIVLQQLPFTAVFFSGNNAKILDMDVQGWLQLYGIGVNYPAYPQDYPLWFMRDLFVMFLIYPAIKALVSKFPKLSLAAGIVLLFVPDYWFKTALAWFLIGGALVQLNIHITLLDKFSFWKICLVYGVCLVSALLFSSVPCVKTAFVLVGIFFLLRLSKVIYDNVRARNIILRLSNYTFIIYAFHEMTLSSVKKVFLRLLPQTDLFLFLEYNLIPFFVMGICIFVGIAMKKNMPTFYALVTGGR